MTEQPRILFVEDDPLLVSQITAHFSKKYPIANDLVGDRVFELLQDAKRLGQPFHIVVTDIMLPKANGLLLTRSLSEQGQCGVILISGKDTETDRIVGLSNGADDYLCKPFNMVELELRIQALWKRIAKNFYSDLDGEEHIKFASFLIHPENRTLTDVSGEETLLTEGELQILLCMIANIGKPVSRSTLAASLNQRDWHPSDRSIDVLVGRLRKKLNDDTDKPRYLVTVRGKGYMLVSNISY